MDPTDTVDLRAWIGRTEIAHDRVAAAPVRALAATLDHPDAPAPEGTPLPPLWHWLFFLPLHRASELGDDGHARRGGFLPPVPLPRRMWAGGRFEFRAPVRIGEDVVRTSTVEDVRARQGRSGPLVFVTVRHELRGPGEREPALVEWHDIVYRQARRDADPTPAPPRAEEAAHWSRTIVPDAVLLFRYSALTFNGHRIHYDRRYATEVEGYRGLVVHGPLIATLLVDLLRRHRPDAELAGFAFKAMRPAFDERPLTLCGRHEGSIVRLWAHDHEGALVMDATATLRGA
jgi:3-methylfumaryl-CoA hydratase